MEKNPTEVSFGLACFWEQTSSYGWSTSQGCRLQEEYLHSTDYVLGTFWWLTCLLTCLIFKTTLGRYYSLHIIDKETEAQTFGSVPQRPMGNRWWSQVSTHYITLLKEHGAKKKESWVFGPGYANNNHDSENLTNHFLRLYFWFRKTRMLYQNFLWSDWALKLYGSVEKDHPSSLSTPHSFLPIIISLLWLTDNSFSDMFSSLKFLCDLSHHHLWFWIIPLASFI